MTDLVLDPRASIPAPDPILAELWEVKRQLNEEAGYRIDVLARMAHEASERVKKGFTGNKG